LLSDSCVMRRASIGVSDTIAALLFPSPAKNVVYLLVIHVCMYVCMYVHAYVRTYVCMYVRTYVRMYVCMYVYVCMCIYTFLSHKPWLSQKNVGDGKNLLIYLNSAFEVLLGLYIFPRVPKIVYFVV
jgi:hypothetical protein